MTPLVVLVEDLEAGRTEQFAFLKSPVRVGRGELNDLPLARPFVSTYHGVIQFDDAEARYLDLGSTNGSVLDGSALDRNAPALLGPGAELVIGSFRLTFSRRMTGEQLAAPRAQTMFQKRVGTGTSLSALPAVAAAAAVASSAALRQAVAPEGALPAPTPALSAPPPEVATDPRAEEAARRAIEAAGFDLDLDYASYRGTWEHLRNAIEGVVAGLEPPARRAALAQLASRYGTLPTEPQFVAMGGPAPAAAAPPPASPAPAAVVAAARGDALGGEALRLLHAFGESYLPTDPRLASGADVEVMLGRVSAALETFARSFLELRKGHEEFGREMGVRAAQGESALHRARDARQLLGYLLDPRAEGRERELQRAFADYMLHQVALLRGVVDGARALLGEISPETIAGAVAGSVWPMRQAALWKAYEERFHGIADEDDAVSDLLFGKEFARAYASMVGQGPAEAGQDGPGKTGRGR